VDWEELCAGGNEMAKQIVRGRIANRTERSRTVDEIIEKMVLALDQRRLRLGEHDRSESIGVDSVDLPALERVLSEPRIDVVGAGAILLCDSKRLHSDV
jgi:hypothetical protein